jgi:hypothetical protein
MKRRAPEPDDAFHRLFPSQAEFSSKLAEYLTTQDATSLRVVSKSCRAMVAEETWPHFVKIVVTDVEKWRACFPNAVGLTLKPVSKRSRDYRGLAKVLFLNVESMDTVKLPTYLLRSATNLLTLEMKGVPREDVKRLFSHLSPTVLTVHAKLDDAAVPTLANIEGIVSMPLSSITDTALQKLHPELKGLNVGGCYRLTDHGLANMSCRRLQILNVSYTHVTDDGVQRIPNVGELRIVVFGFNPNITERVFESLKHVEQVFLYNRGNPFNAETIASLKTRGVEVFEIDA